jgi:hypothetical protein
MARRTVLTTSRRLAPGLRAAPRQDGVRRLLFFLVILTALFYASSRGNDMEISFQSFVRSFLEKGLVERIEVVNRTMACVCLQPGLRPSSCTTGLSAEEALASMNAGSVDGSGRSGGCFDISGSTGEFGGERDWSSDGGDSALAGSPDASASVTTRQWQLKTGEAQYYFNIGTVDSFDLKLQTIQEDLGFTPRKLLKPPMSMRQISWQKYFATCRPSIYLASAQSRWATRCALPVPAHAEVRFR